jgi:hypothetical protein
LGHSTRLVVYSIVGTERKEGEERSVKVPVDLRSVSEKEYRSRTRRDGGDEPQNLSRKRVASKALKVQLK